MNIQTNRRLVCISLALLTWQPGMAANEDAKSAEKAEVESIVVTASRLDQSADDLTQTIEVITRDDIERLWAASAAEVLRQVPGTNVIQQGGRGGVSSILLRGGEPNFTVVLVDGVQVNDPTNTRGGSYDIGSLEQAQIGRVEMIFGPMSPVYGSDALSGVVNFLTRGAESGSDVSVETGTQGYGSASAFYGGTLAGIDTGVGVFGTNDEGDVEGADYEARGVNGKFSSEFGGAGSANLSLGYQQTETEGFPEDSGGPELAVIREVDEREFDETRVGFDVSYLFADRWQTKLFANYYNRDEEYSSPGIAPGELQGFPPNSAATDFDRKQVIATLGSDFGSYVSALIGAEWQNENGKSDGVIEFPNPPPDPPFGPCPDPCPVPTNFELDRDTIGAFLEANAEVGRFVVQGSLRWDDPDNIDSVWTGSLGVLYRFADDLTELRANWGQGFKAPSFFALAHPIVGNPDLKSETGESVDLGIRRNFAGNNGAVEFAVFYNDYEDLIDFDSETFKNVNRDNVVTKGAEAAVVLEPLETLYLKFHLTYLDTEVKGSDAILRGRPEWRGGAVVDWEFVPRWRWVTSVLALDEFYESSVPTGGVWLDGYVRVDSTLSWQATEKLRIGLAVDNLFDEDYEEAVGFPAAGTRGRLGAKYSF